MGGTSLVTTLFAPMIAPYPTLTPENRGVDTDPNFILNDNGTAVSRTAVFRIGVMVDGNDVYFRTDQNMFAECNAATSEKRAALLDKAAFTYLYMLAVIHIKWR